LGLPIDETLFVVGLILALLNLLASIGLALNTIQMLRLLVRRQQGHVFLDDVMAMRTSNDNNNNANDTNLGNLEEPLLLDDINNFLNSRTVVYR
jgi:hypothetical protein